MGLNLITDVLDVLDRHGYNRGDDEHAGRAIFLISDLAHIYEGSQDHPFGPTLTEIPPRTEPAPPEPASQHAVLVPVGEVKTLLVALDIAAESPRAHGLPRHFVRQGMSAATGPAPATARPPAPATLPTSASTQGGRAHKQGHGKVLN